MSRMRTKQILGIVCLITGVVAYGLGFAVIIKTVIT